MFGKITIAGAAALLGSATSPVARSPRPTPGRPIWSDGTRKTAKLHASRFRPDKPLAPRAKLSLGKSYAGERGGRRVYKTVGRRLVQVG